MNKWIPMDNSPDGGFPKDVKSSKRLAFLLKDNDTGVKFVLMGTVSFLSLRRLC